MRALCLVLLVVFVLFSGAVLAGSPTSPLPSAQNVSLLDRIGLAIKSTLFGQIKVAETHRKAGGVFNGDYPTYTLDTKYHDYEILYSGRKVMFTIDGALIHTVEAGEEPIVAIRHLKPFMSSVSTGVGAVAGLRTLSLTISLLGTPKTQPLNRHIAGATAGTLIKTGPGTLRMLSVNSSTNASQITVYDALNASDSSKIIADIKLNVSAPPVPMPYEWDFNTGLYVVITGTGTDISIGYE